MTINISLSEESIGAAIARLEEVKENLTFGVNDLVEVLAHDGAEVANEAYGSMAAAAGVPVSMDSAQIVVVGGDKAIIAEFGAGYATMEYHPFAKKAPVPIEVGSYSREHQEELHGGMFYISDQVNPGEGYWFFGGREYDRVQPRHGLLNASDYIRENAARIASEVIKL